MNTKGFLRGVIRMAIIWLAGCGVVLAQNQPGPHSPLPYAIYIAPAFAVLGQ